MLRVSDEYGVRGTIGVAIDDPSLVRSVARILAVRGRYEVAIFDRNDVEAGTWPQIPCEAVVASPEAFGRRVSAECSGYGSQTRVILALRRSAMAKHRDKIVAADAFVLTDESLLRLPSLVPLSAFTLSIMPRGANRLNLKVSPRLDQMKMLSRRDLQVLGELSLGRDNQAIARELGMSVPTAKTHIRRIVERLGFRNRTDAAVFGAVFLGSQRSAATHFANPLTRKG